MKIADFRGEITPNGQISVPPEVASQVPAGKKVAVVIAWGASEEESHGARQVGTSSKLRTLLTTQFTNN